MEKSLAPALTKGLHIVDLVAQEESMTFGQLQKMTGYNVSSLNRYLKVLIEASYLSKTKDNKYILGIKFALISTGPSQWKVLRNKTSNLMEEISESYKVSVLLLGYEENRYTCLNKVAHKDNMTMMSIGHQESPISGHPPWGIPYLASLSKVKQEEVFQEGEDKEKILRELLDQYNEKGYLVYRSQSNDAIVRVAVPIKDQYGHLIGILGMGTFDSSRYTENLTNIVEKMQQGKFVLL